jgi:hypothetical protein
VSARARDGRCATSRKLIFAAGLAATLSCQLRPPKALAVRESQTEEDYATIMADHLLTFANLTPLDTVAWLAAEFGASQSVVLDLFESYDTFLGILGDEDKRERLDGLTPDTMNDDALFAETRRIGNRFQDGLSRLFFATDSKLTEAAQRYGVF